MLAHFIVFASQKDEARGIASYKIPADMGEGITIRHGRCQDKK